MVALITTIPFEGGTVWPRPRLRTRYGSILVVVGRLADDLVVDPDVVDDHVARAAATVPPTPRLVPSSKTISMPLMVPVGSDPPYRANGGTNLTVHHPV